ncbi:hypothetical protein BC829DRAFT_447804 [Chytridium lagenaria]|nr:hypothetical protein BC829DRAFT_447804 [Chytridium lagenaria]
MLPIISLALLALSLTSVHAQTPLHRIPDCVKTCLAASQFSLPEAPYDLADVVSICTQGAVLGTDTARRATIVACVNLDPTCSAVASTDGSVLSTLLANVLAPCAALDAGETTAETLTTTAAVPGATVATTATSASVALTTTRAVVATTTAAAAPATTSTKSGAASGLLWMG